MDEVFLAAYVQEGIRQDDLETVHIGVDAYKI